MELIRVRIFFPCVSRSKQIEKAADRLVQSILKMVNHRSKGMVTHFGDMAPNWYRYWSGTCHRGVRQVYLVKRTRNFTYQIYRTKWVLRVVKDSSGSGYCSSQVLLIIARGTSGI